MSPAPKSDPTTPVYWRVSPRIWRNRAWSDDDKLLACYLLTCSHRNLEGLFVLPLGYVFGDLRWEPERLTEPFGILTGEGFACYDDDTELCLIVKALKYQKTDNENVRTSVCRRIATTPETTLDATLMASAVRYDKPLAERLHKEFPKRFGKPEQYLTELDSTEQSSTARARELGAEEQRARRKSEDPAPLSEIVSKTLKAATERSAANCEAAS